MHNKSTAIETKQNVFWEKAVVMLLLLFFFGMFLAKMPKFESLKERAYNYKVNHVNLQGKYNLTAKQVIWANFVFFYKVL